MANPRTLKQIRSTLALIAATTLFLACDDPDQLSDEMLEDDESEDATPNLPLRAPDTDPSAATYSVPANQLSGQFMFGTCRYRIWYGNYGPTPFAKLRMYGGDCTGFRVYVFHEPGSWTVDPYVYAGGVDAHGSYYELQATGPTPAYAEGVAVCPPATQATQCEFFRP